ncbi:hypothetical protein GXP71_15940 [Cellulomonas sp. H30R-01]|uniref:hypothetical protein n=1 Tax=Cellulomonas sp. H30R-01 TaxID=2704467 RepID=UPI00138BCA0C|nr:hypothetical protein [Cellulomonas sp. H30R-01]QHT57412.1 hypothetical protein GXP71_15940 [Cellulomonas sp. H30R-01]
MRVADGPSGEEIAVVWTAFPGRAGHGAGVSRESVWSVVAQRFAELLADGGGYLEVGPAGDGHPLVAIGFDEHVAVVHLFPDPSSCLLLVGDRSRASDDVVRVPVLDSTAEFEGVFATAPRDAWRVVERVLRHGADGSHWFEV